MNAERIEGLLRGVPTRGLAAEHEAALIAALCAAAAARGARGWRRPVRLWTAAAACTCVGLLSAGLTAAWHAGASRFDEPFPAAVAVRAHLDAPLFAARADPPVRGGFAEWRVLDVKPNGGNE